MNKQYREDLFIEDVVKQVGNSFPTFGGGRGSEWNPVAEALKNKPTVFAAGVDVKSVVEFVFGLTRLQKSKRRK